MTSALVIMCLFVDLTATTIEANAGGQPVRPSCPIRHICADRQVIPGAAQATACQRYVTYMSCKPTPARMAAAAAAP